MRFSASIIHPLVGKSVGDLVSNFIPNIDKEGYVFIAIFFVISCVAFAVSWGIGIVCLFFTFFCTAFFRDPPRAVPDSDHVLLSPADGMVVKVEKLKYLLDSEANEEDEVFCVSIFLSVFNVHVNRIPVSGVVEFKKYRPGRFISASLDKSSEENEKQVIAIKTASGLRVVVEQIAGLIARRIVCNLEEGQEVKMGERFGIIRFGSRVNLCLPKGIKPLVAVGQTVVGGETVLADLKGSQKEISVNIV